MATNDDIARLLQRCEVNGLGGKRTEQEMGRLLNEWLKVLGSCNAKLLDEALTAYIANDTKAYARLPKSGELRQIYDNLVRERQLKNSLSAVGSCPWCSGGGKALIRAKEDKPFYGHYGVLGITCPCRRGETQALQNGLKITRRVKPGNLDIWLESGLLWGYLREFGRKKEFNQELPKQQTMQAFGNSFTADDLPF